MKLLISLLVCSGVLFGCLTESSSNQWACMDGCYTQLQVEHFDLTTKLPDEMKPIYDECNQWCLDTYG